MAKGNKKTPIIHSLKWSFPKYIAALLRSIRTPNKQVKMYKYDMNSRMRGVQHVQKEPDVRC